MAAMNRNQLKDQIKQKCKLLRKEKAVAPELCDVWIHGLSSTDAEYWRRCNDDTELRSPYLTLAHLMQLSLYDDSGIRLFDETEIMELGTFNESTYSSFKIQANKLNGWVTEEVVKNLKKILGIDGSAVSPENTTAPLPNSSTGTKNTNLESSTPSSKDGRSESPPKPSDS